MAAWDANAAAYAAAVSGDDSISARFAGFLAEELGPLPGLRVLDLGCGHGWLAGRLAAQGARVVGIDGSAELLGMARRQHPGLAFHQADLSQGLGSSVEGHVDRVVALMVLMDWAVIPGPNVTTGIYGPPPSEMPPATCIEWVCSK